MLRTGLAVSSLLIILALSLLRVSGEEGTAVCLTVNSPLEGCRVLIDGEAVGVTPLVRRIRSSTTIDIEVFTPDGKFSLRGRVSIGPEKRIVVLADFRSGKIIVYRTVDEILQYIDRQSRIAEFRLRYRKALQFRKERKPAEALAMLEAALNAYDEPTLYPLLLKWRRETIPRGFVYVRGGSFRMGQDAKEFKGDELQMPAHDVCVSDFAMMKTEVTNAMFRRFVRETHYVTTAEVVGSAFDYDNKTHTWRLLRNASWKAPRGGKKKRRVPDSLPVCQLSWNDCVAFARWYGAFLGVKYGKVRLPTEAEWELAARGLEGRRFPWGDVSPFADRSLAQVGSKRSNVVGLKKGCTPEGICDLIGNVWEWCYDVADGDYYRLCKEKGLVCNPMGPLSGDMRVIRGGGFDADEREARSTVRRFMPADKMALNVGFRLVIAFNFKLYSGKK